MKLFLNLLVSTLAILITAYLIPGVQVANFFTALVLAVVLGILNTLIKPILIILTLPINILTLGLFTLVINAFLILLASSLVVGFYVSSFGWAILFSLILSLVNSFLHSLSR